MGGIICAKINLAKPRFIAYLYSMDEITIGTQILVGLRWLIVDEIDTENGLLWCIDQDGGDHEINRNAIDHIYRLAKIS